MISADDLRNRLSDLAKLGAQTSRAGAKIRESAADRLTTVQARIDELRPRALTDSPSAEEYQSLTEERGRLAINFSSPGDYAANRS